MRRVTRNAPPTVAQANHPEINLGMRFPNQDKTRNPASGKNKMSQLSEYKLLPFQDIDAVHIQLVPGAENRQYDSETYHHFRRSNRHDDQRKDLPVQ